MLIPEKALAGMPWYKSTHSGDASNCVEAVAIDLQSVETDA
jgi:hypothetical protein